MTHETTAIPESLLRGFYAVSDPLLVSRYNAALESIGSEPTALRSFRVDAAGHSPEVAAERGDALYLGRSALVAQAIVVAAEQIRAPVVHPGIGFASEAYRRTLDRSSKEVRSLLLREPLIAHASHGSTELAEDRHLADPTGFELQFRTPGGHLAGSRRLEEMKEEFLASDRLWLDDAFIDEMARLAGRVRGLGPVPESLAASDHALGPFHTPAFGGSYVVEERGGRMSTTTILSGSRERAETFTTRALRERRIDLKPLRAEAVVAFLIEHRIAHFDERRLRDRPEVLAGIQHWVGVDHLASEDPQRLRDAGDADVVDRMLRDATALPTEFTELADARRRIRSKRRELDFEALSPITRLRMLTPSSRRPDVRRFVRHLCAHMDPANLEWAWRGAPDLFFGSLPELRPEIRAYFSRWLETRAGR